MCDFVKNGLKKPQKADGFRASNWGAWERASGWEDEYQPHRGRVGSSPRHMTVARGVEPVTLAGNRPRILAPGRLRTQPQPPLARIREGPQMTPTRRYRVTDTTGFVDTNIPGVIFTSTHTVHSHGRVSTVGQFFPVLATTPSGAPRQVSHNRLV